MKEGDSTEKLVESLVKELNRIYDPGIWRNRC